MAKCFVTNRTTLSKYNLVYFHFFKVSIYIFYAFHRDASNDLTHNLIQTSKSFSFSIDKQLDISEAISSAKV